MFDFTGEKFNSLVKGIFWVESVIITAGIIVLVSILFCEEEEPALFALLAVIPVGILLAWLKSVILIMFGNLCSDIHKLSYNTSSTSWVKENKSGLDLGSNSGSKSSSYSIFSDNDSWTCSCGRRNDNSEKYCERCGKERRVVSNSSSYRIHNDSWVCNCGKRNDSSKKYCEQCGKERQK